MSQVEKCPQSQFLKECRKLRASLQDHALTLDQGSIRLNDEKLKDMARDMTRLSLQVDETIRLGLRMVDTGCKFIKLNPEFWYRGGNSQTRFERVFYSMQNTLDRIGMALQVDSRYQAHSAMIKDLRGIASVLETNLGL